MDIKVQGGVPLAGEVTTSGYKNSALALIAASILFDKPIVLDKVPDITDVVRLVKIMEKLGSNIEWARKRSRMKIDNSRLRFEDLDREDLGNMRGTSLLWGPMLARFGKVEFKELPGGCTLGMRPLDSHYKAFRDLGVKVVEEPHSVKMNAKGAGGGEVWLSEMSPTATENVLMLASGLRGTTKIFGAASDLQVQDVCRMLLMAGVKIDGVGSSVLEVEGTNKISPVEFELSPDIHEISTFLSIAAVTGGKVKVKNALNGFYQPVRDVFGKFGVEIVHEGDAAIVDGSRGIKINKYDNGKTLVVRAQPWPALPVDSLPVFIPLALAADKGQVLFHNWMYEAGLFWTTEFSKMGADVIVCDPHRVIVVAGQKLSPAILEAPYIIRATVALLMGAMIAEGESTILNADTIHRGHPNFVENLRKLGAKIEEINGEEQ